MLFYQNWQDGFLSTHFAPFLSFSTTILNCKDTSVSQGCICTLPRWIAKFSLEHCSRQKFIMCFRNAWNYPQWDFFPLAEEDSFIFRLLTKGAAKDPLLYKQKSIKNFQEHEKIWQTQLEFFSCAGRRLQKGNDKFVSLDPCIYHFAFNNRKRLPAERLLPRLPRHLPPLPPLPRILKSSSSNFLIWLPALFFVWLNPPGAAPPPARPRPGSSGPPRPGPGRAAAAAAGRGHAHVRSTFPGRRRRSRGGGGQPAAGRGLAPPLPGRRASSGDPLEKLRPSISGSSSVGPPPERPYLEKPKATVGLRSGAALSAAVAVCAHRWQPDKGKWSYRVPV